MTIKHDLVKAPPASENSVAGRKRLPFEPLIPVIMIGVIAWLLRSVPTDILREELEGFGVAISAVACGGLFIRRVVHLLHLEEPPPTPSFTVNPATTSTLEPTPAEPHTNLTAPTPAARSNLQ